VVGSLNMFSAKPYSEMAGMATAGFGGAVVVQLVCEVCGVAYKQERHWGDWWARLARRCGGLLERGLCGRCTERWLKIDSIDRRTWAREGRKVKYVHGAGYVQGVLQVKRRRPRLKS